MEEWQRNQTLVSREKDCPVFEKGGNNFRRQFDFIAGNYASFDQLDNRQKQEWLMRGMAAMAFIYPEIGEALGIIIKVFVTHNKWG